MAEESNVHVKVAMADVMGILVVSMFTFAVAVFGLDIDKTGTLIAAIGPFVGLLCIVVAIFMYYNENLLGTAIFGPLAVFFLTITAPAILGVTLSPESTAMLCVVIGIIALIDTLLSLAQPVKMLPILLGVAAIAFFVTAGFYWQGNNDLKMAVGALWMIYSLISFYMGAAIVMLVLKGKQVLPLLIKA
jgi:succinate-acetate transporter protein